MDAGMKITSQEDVEKALKSIGFYRLRGYSFQLYDNAAMNITVRQSRQSGVARATCPD